jgi:hypothetical protein
VTVGGVAEIERWAQLGLQAVDRGQARGGKLKGVRPAGRVVRVGFERRDGDAHPVGQREGAEQTVQLRPTIRAVQAEGLGLAGCHRRLPNPDQVPGLRQAGGGGRLAAVALLDPGPRSAVRNVDVEPD